MGSQHYFLLAAFVVAAALLKFGVPWIPVVVGIGIAGLWNVLWSRRKRRR